MHDSELDRLIQHIATTIDLAKAANGVPTYWSSLPLCIIDSVFSIRAKYSGVIRVVNRWCESQEPHWQGEVPSKPIGDRGPTLREFVEAIDGHLKKCAYDELFGNRQRTSAKNGILKAEAVHLFAKALLDSGINSFSDLRDRSKLGMAEKRVLEIRGQGSGITFRYLLMLAGEDGYVKADTHLRRFVSDAIGADWKQLIPQERATELVMDAAKRLAARYPGLTPGGLDFAIWSFQRQRTKPVSCTVQPLIRGKG